MYIELFEKRKKNITYFNPIRNKKTTSIQTSTGVILEKRL
jgi:hypothetical protein